MQRQSYTGRFIQKLFPFLIPRYVGENLKLRKDTSRFLILLRTSSIITDEEFVNLDVPTKLGRHFQQVFLLSGMYGNYRFDESEEVLSSYHRLLCQMVVYLEAGLVVLLNRRWASWPSSADRVDDRDRHYRYLLWFKCIIKNMERRHPHIEKAAIETKTAPACQDVSHELEDSLTFSNLVSNICCACVRTVLFLSIH